ncbi:MAG TPA: hypothetical protein VJU83_10350 [Burkholderiales bacterium]|nr:hypothetical protein [Burkholderiales bacterium]
MTDKDIRQSFWEQPGVTPYYTAQMHEFLEIATELRFETRFIGEKKWWPVKNEEVAHTLGTHYTELQQQLARMIDGEVSRSPVAEFRIVEKRTASTAAVNFAAI